MSRSYRHTPRMGIAGTSDKIGKRYAHKALRVAERCVVALEAEVWPAVRETSDPYDFPKDGKRQFDPIADAKYWRK